MITLSMIVKNEEKYLRECLESVRSVVDEIVIVDTGSNDNTKKIAEQFGAKIFDYEWKKDFADARNFALSKSSGDWILYLDADERLNKNSIQEIKKLSSSKSKAGYYCRILNVDEISKRPSVMSYVRFFANSPKICFEGKVHEQIENSLFQNGYELKGSGIEITHLGYNLAGEELKTKAKRNLEILLGEYSENKSGYLAFQIGQTLHKLERETEAVEYFTNAIEDKSLRNEYKATCFRSIAIYNAEKSDYQKAARFIKMSLENDSQQPLSLLTSARIEFKLGNANKALQFVKDALKYNLEYLSGKKVSSQNILLDQKTIIYNGLLISVQNDDSTNIIFFLEQLKKISSVDEFKFFDEIIKRKNILSSAGKKINYVNAENIELLFVAIDKMPDKKNALELIESLEDNFKGKSFFYNKYGYILLAQGHLDKAENALKKSLEINANEFSSVFYLISIYVQQNRIDKILSLINEHRHNVETIPEIAAKLNAIEQKLKNIL